MNLKVPIEQMIISDEPLHFRWIDESGWRIKFAEGWQLRSFSDEPLVDGTGFGLSPAAVVSEIGGGQAYFQRTFALDIVDSLPKRLRLKLDFDGLHRLKCIVSFVRDPNSFESLFREPLEYNQNPGGNVNQITLGFAERGTYYGRVHVYFPREVGARLTISNISSKLSEMPAANRDLHFDFFTFGDETKASSRLRAWRIADQLKTEGYDVRVNPSEERVKESSPEAVGGTQHVIVFQKVKSLKDILQRTTSNSLMIYDFDDHVGAEGPDALADFVSFIDNIDLITVGSNHLKQFADKYHPDVYVLENPVDIAEDGLARPARGKLDKICWFGAPEGLKQLYNSNITDDITTITRGGDIEYDLSTIDDNLTAFDLCVLPLEVTNWNLSKNANRMVKAVALGVPVLASATPEHQRVAKQLGLDERFLINDNSEWSAKIRYLKDNFGAVEDAILAARQAALAYYDLGTIVEGWLDRISKAQKRRLRDINGRRETVSIGAQERASVLIIDSRLSNLNETLDRTELSWDRFEERRIITVGRESNFSVSRSGFTHIFSRDPSHLFSDAQAELAAISTTHALIIPTGYILKYSCTAAFGMINDDPNLKVVALGSNALAKSQDKLPQSEYDLPEFLLSPRSCGPLLVDVQWCLENVSLASTLGYYSWAICIAAISQPGAFAKLDFPSSLRLVTEEVPDLSDQYARWLKAHAPMVLTELPNMRRQWERLSFDIISRSTARAGAWCVPALSKAIIQLSKKEK